LRGYLFNQQFIFTDYVQDLYGIKSSVHKSDPMYTISKLLLNSLYGRFGLHAETLLSQTQLLTNEEMYAINDKISDVLAVGYDKKLVTWICKDDDEIEMDNFNQMNISLPIAAAVTAYARRHMTQFINNPHYNLYYTDTDSIVIDKPLDPTLVDDKRLGLMKLENVYNEFVAIAPKVYGGEFLNEERKSKEITKVSWGGYKGTVPLVTLKSLLITHNKKISHVELSHQKLIRDYEKGIIRIEDQNYNLMPTNNKREIIIKAQLTDY